jgi:hypothetical protein
VLSKKESLKGGKKRRLERLQAAKVQKEVDKERKKLAKQQKEEEVKQQKALAKAGRERLRAEKVASKLKVNNSIEGMNKAYRDSIKFVVEHGLLPPSPPPNL